MSRTKRFISMVLCMALCLSSFSGIPVYAETENEDKAQSETAEDIGSEPGNEITGPVEESTDGDSGQSASEEGNSPRGDR